MRCNHDAFVRLFPVHGDVLHEGVHVWLHEQRGHPHHHLAHRVDPHRNHLVGATVRNKVKSDGLEHGHKFLRGHGGVAGLHEVCKDGRHVALVRGEVPLNEAATDSKTKINKAK